MVEVLRVVFFGGASIGGLSTRSTTSQAAVLALDPVAAGTWTASLTAIRRWLVDHRRFQVHFTPTYSSWLNLVERWFAELTTTWLKRGSHRSVPELTASIQSWIETWNEQPRPFVWHKTADQILDSIARYLQPISNSGH